MLAPRLVHLRTGHHQGVLMSGTAGMTKVPFPMASQEVATLARRMTLWGRELVYSAIEWVPVRDLVATQDEVSARRVEELSDITCPGPIDVARIGKQLVIVEGHHRATVAARRGHSSIYARVCSPPPIGTGENP